MRQNEKKKFLINNTMEALIPFKEDHQNPNRHCTKFQCGKKWSCLQKKGIFFEVEK